MEFTITYVVNITVTTLGVYVLVDLFKLNETISPLLASFAAIPFIFFISKNSN